MKDSEAEVRYKVGEVCRLADVQPYVLKYWESEFPVLAPDRSVPGPRTYSARELGIIERIKKLLYDEGYTIAGAKKRLEAELREPPPAEPPALVLTPPPPAPEAPAARARKARAKAPLSEQPLVFEELVSEAPAEPEPIGGAPTAAAPEPLVDAVPVEEPLARSIEPAIDRSPAPMAQSPDPRLAMAVAELKEILRILKADPA